MGRTGSRRSPGCLRPRFRRRRHPPGPRVSRQFAAATTAYAYDDNDRVESITRSGPTSSPHRIDFTYNEQNQFDTIARFTGTNADPSLTTTYAYDTLNRLSSLTHGNATPTPVESYGYTYDAEDRITRIAELSGTIDYAYDGRGQLTAATYSDPNRTDESYAFDANGNREASTNATGTQTGYQTESNNRLSTGGRYTYTYNDRGDTIRRTDTATGDHRDFVWDHRGRLVKVADLLADGTMTGDVTYTHDPLDRRIGRTVDDGQATTTESFVYDGQDVLLDFVDGDLSSRYTHGPAVDQVLAREVHDPANPVSDPELLYHLHDHLGSTRNVTDAAGVVVNTIQLDAFGNLTDQSDPAYATRYLFTGRELDAATGLYHYRARSYDAATGRFLSEDPIGFGGGDTNVYRYVDNAPTMYIDPRGWFKCGPLGTGPSPDLPSPTNPPPRFSGGGEATWDPPPIGEVVEPGSPLWEWIKTFGAEFLPGAANTVADESPIGPIKALAEAGAGQDARGNKLSGWERVLAAAGAIPGVATGRKLLNGAGDVAGAASDISRRTAPKGGTYKLLDPETGQVRRTGRSNDLNRRRGEHGRHPETRDLDFEVDRRTDSYPAQRGREQRIHDQHLEADLNRRRPISPTNPRRDEYLQEGDQL